MPDKISPLKVIPRTWGRTPTSSRQACTTSPVVIRRCCAPRSLNSMVAILASGFSVGSGLSPPPSTRGRCPTVTVTPDSRGGASGSRPSDRPSMTRWPAASSSCATACVCCAVVPSGISRVAVAKSPSTSAAKVVGTMPAGSRETVRMSSATAPETVTPRRSVANYIPRSRGPCTNLLSRESTRPWIRPTNRSTPVLGTQFGPCR